MMRYYIPFFICLTLVFLRSSYVTANEVEKINNETEWALGLGLGVFNYHLYPGAKETNKIILPAPYFTYRSPKFEIDRGIKSFIYNSEEIVIDLSADFGLPVNSDDTLARKGMPNLDLMLQFGPSLEFMLNDRRKNYFDVRFEIPVRVAFVTDFHSVDHIGYLVEPRFTFNHKRIGKTGLSHKTTLGLKFATEDFYAYYYDVAPEFATPVRTVFNSDAGFGGSFVNYRITYKTSDFVYWMFLRYQSLRGAEFEDSPLVLQNDYSFIGFGFAWIFAGSL
jgi:outer membrane scaffolding protein for murein synthesis (MipA/OmpV family)